MGSWGLGCRLGQLDVAIALPWLKKVICHSSWRRSPNPLCPLSRCRHRAPQMLPPRRGLTDLPHHSPASTAWKSRLALQHCKQRVKNRTPPAPAVLLGTITKALSVAGCLLIQRCSTRQLWLPKVGSDISGLGVPPFLPQECASGCKRRQAKPNHHSSVISFCGYNYLLKKFPFFFCS